ncbi:MAG: GAF domain-containing protein [Myxococcota bacterium]
MAEDKQKPASDLPQDLIKEREQFVRSFLKKGVEYTESLLEENTELRGEIQRLRDENARLRSHVASDDAIRDLLKTIEKLEGERGNLLERSSRLERTEREHAGRQAEIEQEINDLANLYIANFQLHASLSIRRVVRHLCDMAGQLIGGESFVVYVVDEDAKKVVPVASEALLPDETPEALDIGAGPIGEACLTGIRRIRDTDLQQGSFDDPAAIVPLLADGKAIGVVAILRLLEQKQGWASVDHELFELLAAQAGAALIAANLYADQDGPTLALRGLAGKL